MNKIRWLKLRRQTIGQRYALAFLVLAVTIALRQSLTSVLGDRAPTLVFTVAVMISASLGGLGPGIFTMFFGFMAARYLWIPPIHQFWIDTPELITYALVYMIVSFGIIVFSILLRVSLLERIENEQRFGSLFKYNLDAVFVLDSLGNFDAVNPQAIRLTGYTEQELRGHSFDFLCRPDQIQAVQYSLQRALEGRSRDFEFSIIRKDGSTAELQFSAGPIIVQDETSGIFGVAKDITSRKHSEAVLRDVVKSVKCILSFSDVFAREGYEKDSIATGYQTIRARMTVVDEEAAQHVLPLEVGRGESYASAWLRSRHPEDIATMRDLACRATIDGARSYSQEFRAVDKFGVEHWFFQLVTVEPKGPRRWLRVAVTTDITERKRAEQVLSESEARYKTLFESNPAAVMIMDAEENPGKFISLNGMAAAMHGYSVKEMLKLGIQDLDAPETAVLRQERLKRLGAGERLTFEAVHRRKDGTLFPLEVTTVMMDLAGKKCIMSIERDITERKRASKALEESEARLNAAFASVPFDFWVADAEGRYMIQNPTAIENWGNQVGKRPEDLPVDESIRELWRAMNKRALAGQIVRGEATYQQHGVTRHVYEIVAPVFAGAEVRGLLGVGIDITERKRAEEALRASEERFRAIFEQAAVGVAQIASISGRLVRVNQKFCEILGYTEKELLAKTFLETSHPDDLELERGNMRALIAGRIPTFSMERRCLAKSGEIVWISLTVSPLCKPGAEDDFHIAVVSDITERKRMDEELLRAKEDAENANISKDRFLAVLSHELRTPLNPVLMAIHAWKTEPGLPTQLIQDFQMMRHNIEIEVRLISDLLDLTSISKGKLSLQSQPVDIHELLIYAINIVQSQTGEKNLQITEQLYAIDPYVRSDPTRLQQVFWNLISNAVKFTPDGGSLIISSRNEHDCIVVDILDSGFGIDPAVIEKIFDPFEQGNPEITALFGGLGLGLSIAKGFVELLGGTISARSEGSGRGSTFTVTLKTLKDPLAAGL